MTRYIYQRVALLMVRNSISHDSVIVVITTFPPRSFTSVLIFVLDRC